MLQTTFDRIYLEDSWNGGSGPGSDPEHLKEYVAYINGLIRDLNVRWFLDVGCGDCRLAKMLNLSGVNYLGIDVSQAALDLAVANGAGHLKLRRGTVFDVPYVYDLVHIKDVFQHLPFATVSDILAGIAKHKHAVVTNDSPHFPHDCDPGAYRPIDITQPPIYATSYKPDRIFNINGFNKLAVLR